MNNQITPLKAQSSIIKSFYSKVFDFKTQSEIIFLDTSNQTFIWLNIPFYLLPNYNSFAFKHAKTYSLDLTDDEERIGGKLLFSNINNAINDIHNRVQINLQHSEVSKHFQINYLIQELKGLCDLPENYILCIIMLIKSNLNSINNIHTSNIIREADMYQQNIDPILYESLYLFFFPKAEFTGLVTQKGIEYVEDELIIKDNEIRYHKKIFRLIYKIIIVTLIYTKSYENRSASEILNSPLFHLLKLNYM